MLDLEPSSRAARSAHVAGAAPFGDDAFDPEGAGGGEQGGSVVDDLRRGGRGAVQAERLEQRPPLGQGRSVTTLPSRASTSNATKVAGHPPWRHRRGGAQPPRQTFEAGAGRCHPARSFPVEHDGAPHDPAEVRQLREGVGPHLAGPRDQPRRQVGVDCDEGPGPVLLPLKRMCGWPLCCYPRTFLGLTSGGREVTSPAESSGA